MNETRRQWRRDNQDKLRSYKRDNYARQPYWKRRAMRLWTKHRMRPEDFMHLWHEQRGCCYLCGDLLDPMTACVDHDHTHCGADHSCRECWRGLSCQPCNLILGHANDDPERLRLIADNLEKVTR